MNSHYANPVATVRDDPMLEQAGAAHLAIIRAAFQCDLIRVATFQWCPGPPPATDLYLYEFMTNVQTWFNQKTADALVAFKGAVDAYGGNVLEHTVVPMVTNIAHASHVWSPVPALILGGRALGMRGGQYQSVARPQNDFWLSIAGAYLGANAQQALAGETFAQNTASFTGPIAGLWSQP